MATPLKVQLLFVLFLAVPVRGGLQRTQRSDDTSLTSVERLVEQQASVIQALQSRLTATENKLQDAESRLSALESSNQGKSDQIAALNDRLSKSVAFTVHFSSDPIPDVGVQAILKFDRVVFSQGNAYDPHTGIFTAPVAGIYVFYLNLMSHSGAVELRLVKDGTSLDIAHANSDTFDQGSLLATNHLNVGQKVWIEHAHGITSLKGGSWTVFSGFLLKAD